MCCALRYLYLCCWKMHGHPHWTTSTVIYSPRIHARAKAVRNVLGVRLHSSYSVRNVSQALVLGNDGA